MVDAAFASATSVRAAVATPESSPMFILPIWFSEDLTLRSPGIYLIIVHRGKWSAKVYLGQSSNVYRRICAYARSGSHKRDYYRALKMDRHSTGIKGDPGGEDPHWLELKILPTKTHEEAVALETRLLKAEGKTLPWNSVLSGGVDKAVEKHVRALVGPKKAKPKKTTKKDPVKPSGGPTPSVQCPATAKSTGKQCKRMTGKGNSHCSSHRH